MILCSERLMARRVAWWFLKMPLILHLLSFGQRLRKGGEIA
jgi:hypothetical protein